jgi:hypothetical protein
MAKMTSFAAFVSQLLPTSQISPGLERNIFLKFRDMGGWELGP